VYPLVEGEKGYLNEREQERACCGTSSNKAMHVWLPMYPDPPVTRICLCHKKGREFGKVLMIRYQVHWKGKRIMMERERLYLVLGHDCERLSPQRRSKKRRNMEKRINVF
jgi:hypothetical protein